MRVVVTGGAGFVGSHLCEKLLERGDDVICVDNLHTGSTANVAHIADNPRFRMVTHDINSPLDLPVVDRLFNLACPASPVQYQVNPIQTIKTNVYGSLNMLELARRTNARILQASTSEVYGDPEVHPQKEDYWGHVNPIGLRSCYDEGKRCAEGLYFDFRRLYGHSIRVARIFNTYGPRMALDDGRVVSNFIVKALAGEDICLYGDGSQTRCFCYVDDTVRGLMALMDHEDDGVGPVNIGSTKEITVRELAEIVVGLIGSKSKLVFADLPADDPMRRRPDVSKAKGLLGWEMQTTLEEGLGRTVDYFRGVVGT